MNIWALDKDVRIKHLLLLLADRFGSQRYTIDETTDLPAGSVRLLMPDDPAMSIYVYTYGQEEDRYGVHLEYPMLTASATSNAVEMQEGLDFDQLVELLQMYI